LTLRVVEYRDFNASPGRSNSRLSEDSRTSEAVREIILAVRKDGDRALASYTAEFDGIEFGPNELVVPSALIHQAWSDADPEFKEAVLLAAENIKRFQERQLPQDWEWGDGESFRTGQRYVAVERAGLYVPGGRAAYPSSLLMTAVTAAVAGVRDVVVCSPPGETGFPAQELLAAAGLLRDRFDSFRLIRIGGAQAVAAMAYGTDTVPQVDVIAGPGNRYVVAAKAMVVADVGIDLLPGPSEVIVVADAGTDLRLVALDLLAQAEHDPDAYVGVVLIGGGPDGLSIQRDMVETLHAEIKALLVGSPQEKLLQPTVERGIIYTCETIEEAVALVNAIAPEHVALNIDRPWRALGLVKNAGAVYLGPLAAVAYGDYTAGPNHVLPTGGTARFSGALGVRAFQKPVSYFWHNQASALRLGEAAVALARVEGLEYHRRSIEARMVRAAPTGVGPNVQRELRLHANEAASCPPEVADALSALVREVSLNRYPDGGAAELRESIGRWLQVEGEQVLVGNGSDELILLLCLYAARRGGTGLTVRPTFGMYERAAAAAGLPFVTVETRPPDFEVTPGHILEGAARAAREGGPPYLYFICSPNNPTGRRVSNEVITTALSQENAIVVIDEAYSDFAGGDCLDLVRQGSNAVLLRTFSKAAGAAGLRIGYLVGPEGLVSEVNSLRLPYNLNALSQMAGTKLAELGAKGGLEKRAREVLTERAWLYQQLEEVPGIEPLPTEANFILFRVLEAEDGMTAEALWHALQERGILLRRYGSEPLLDDYIRVSVGQRRENEMLIAALAEITGFEIFSEMSREGSP